VTDKKKSFASLPTPISLSAPESAEGVPPTKKKGRRSMPEFDSAELAPSEERGLGVFRAAQKDFGSAHETQTFEEMPRRRMPPPPPQIKPGEFPQRRKGAPKGAQQNVRREPNAIQKIMRFRINPMLVSIAGWGIAAFGIVAVFVWFITNLLVYNSYEVFLDGESMGFIQYHEDLTADEFHNSAVLHLQASRGGVSVQVDQRVTLEQARAPSNDRKTHNEMFAVLMRNFSYTIAATSIYVNGQYEAILQRQEDVDYVELLLQRNWFNDNTVGAEFVDGWETRVEFVCPDETDFDTPDQAFWRLDRTTLQTYPYTVQRGDMLGSIAIRFGTTVNRLMGDNNLTSANIFPGDTLLIQTYLPLLAVRTFDEIVEMEIIEMDVEERRTPELPLNETNIIQQGMNGQQQIVTRITRENGAERSRITLDAEVIIEPVLHIVEIGTGPASSVQRR
jgi:hypothetical protein